MVGQGTGATRPREMKYLLATAVAWILAAWISLQWLPGFAVAFASCCAALLIASRWCAGVARVVTFNVSFIFFALALYESVPVGSPGDRGQAPAAALGHGVREGSYLQAFHVPHAELGYAITPQRRRLRSVLKDREGNLIYDVSYSIDRFGRRAMPTVSEKPTVYFFGGSFTFGEGVDDTETLPEQIRRLTGFNVVNWGVPGYGPHQMLRQLQTENFSKTQVSPPALAVFLLLTGHIDRAAGRAPWDDHGPRFDVNGRSVRWVGRLDEQTPPPLPSPPPGWIAASRSYDVIWRYLAVERPRRAQREEDRKRVLGILTASRDLLSEQFAAPLLIVLWDTIPSNRVDDADWLSSGLAENSIDTIRVSRSVPDLADASLYIEGDGHPSGAAYAKLARRLAPVVVSTLSELQKKRGNGRM